MENVNAGGESTNAGEIVVSSIRTGMKREFAMMMRAQSEFCIPGLGRRRVTRSLNNANVQSSSASKKQRKVHDEEDEEEKSDVVDGDEKTGVVVDMVTEEKEIVKDAAIADPALPLVKNMETKMTKKVALKRVPTKLKDLLETGLLEGLLVRYVRGPKAKAKSEQGLQGVIKGTGILCYCLECDGNVIVSPNQFELHAGSGNKRPPEYIYLENGNSLRDVLNACKDAPSCSLEAAIQNAAGRLGVNQSSFCVNCKESISENGPGKKMLLCDACVVLEESQPSPSETCTSTQRSPLSNDITASAREMSSYDCSKSKDEHKLTRKSPLSAASGSKCKGKLTRKDLKLHKKVFDVLPDGTELAYYVRGQKKATGYKVGTSIYCHCCSEQISPSQFEAHAGCASRRKPYLNIYMSNGASLHEYASQLALTEKIEVHDGLCNCCGKGGETLMHCDQCPRSFHTECFAVPKTAEGNLLCSVCHKRQQKEKFVAHNANAIAAGRVAGVDAMKEIENGSIRIVEIKDEESGCNLCGGRDFSTGAFSDKTVMFCTQCEKEFHVGCLRDRGIVDLKEVPETDWFCCKECGRLHASLQELAVGGAEELPDSLLKIITEKHEGKISSGHPDLEIRWMLRCGRMELEGTTMHLESACRIFHEQFGRILDKSNLKIDLVTQMVHGMSTLRGHDFTGMYTALLTVNSVVVSAVVLRVFGQEVAELPLVATSSDCQGRGYFQALYYRVENLLSTLNVRRLLLPAAPEAMSIWINKFGFQKITKEQVDQYRKDYPIMVFDKTSFLSKSIPRL